MSKSILTREGLLRQLNLALENKLAQLEREFSETEKIEFIGDNKTFSQQFYRKQISGLKKVLAATPPASSTTIREFSFIQLTEAVTEGAKTPRTQKWVLYSPEIATYLSSFVSYEEKIQIRNFIPVEFIGARAGDEFTIKSELHMGYWQTTQFQILQVL